MQRSGGAVIPMLKNSDNEDVQYIKNRVKIRAGAFEYMKEMEKMPTYPVFSESVLSFLDDFSKEILHDKEAKKYADVVTLGFWCRRASIKQMEKQYENTVLRIGCGIAFHIAPSNVAVNFAYSMIASMLAGNSNIVRIPSKEFKQVDIILDAINTTIEKHNDIKKRLLLIQYDRDKKINDYFSWLCDMRVVWGGDTTIVALRESPIRPRTREICFADRYSLCIIDADRYLEDGEKGKIANGFYNDTYLNDQNACTSPKLIIWMGNKVEEAQNIFWQTLSKLVCNTYQINAVQVVDKLDEGLKFACMCNEKSKPLYSGYKGDNLINRISVSAIDDSLFEIHQNSGLFFEYKTNDLKDILPLCTKKVQTVALIDVDEKRLKSFIMENCPRGIDRVVRVGKTLDFSLVWDGYDLIREMSRIITIL